MGGVYVYQDTEMLAADESETSKASMSDPVSESGTPRNQTIDLKMYTQ